MTFNLPCVFSFAGVLGISNLDDDIVWLEFVLEGGRSKVFVGFGVKFSWFSLTKEFVCIWSLCYLVILAGVFISSCILRGLVLVVNGASWRVCEAYWFMMR